MAVYAVRYVYADRPEELAELRPSHRVVLSDLFERGVLLASGPTAAGAQRGALLIVRAVSPEAALEALAEDPFLSAGLIATRDAAEWTQVLGPWSDGV